MIVADEIEGFIPILDVLSYSLSGEDEAGLKRFKSEYLNLKGLPRQFNEIFARHGWVATDDLPVPFMQMAIQVFEEQGINAAEEYMVGKFTSEYFYGCMKRMSAVWVFEDRNPLIELAFVDHRNGRYHASIPVVLAQIDGLIYDIADQSFYEQEKKLGIFSTESKVTGLKSELGIVASRMNKSRNETNTSPLSFPYRNGILHGRDLGYNNEVVSVKCFMNLFALRPWALFIQQNEMKRRQGDDYVEMPKLKIGKKLDQKIKYYLS